VAGILTGWRRESRPPPITVGGSGLPARFPVAFDE
jgi:hypothetical protein